MLEETLKKGLRGQKGCFQVTQNLSQMGDNYLISDCPAGGIPSVKRVETVEENKPSIEENGKGV